MLTRHATRCHLRVTPKPPLDFRLAQSGAIYHGGMLGREDNPWRAPEREVTFSNSN
jgi:hypothetical protein